MNFNKKKQPLKTAFIHKTECYLTAEESAGTGVATGAGTASAESVTVTSGSSSILLLSVDVSFFEQLANTKPPMNAIANNFFIINLIWAKIEIYLFKVQFWIKKYKNRKQLFLIKVIPN